MSVSHDLFPSQIPAHILQEYQFSQEHSTGRYCPNDYGNCAWRAASYVLLDKEDRYYSIKEFMRSTLENKQLFFKQTFGNQEYER